MTALAIYQWADHALLGCPRSTDPVRFTPQEAKILGLLIQRLNRVVHNGTFLSELYRGAVEPGDAQGTLRVQMTNVRRKLRKSGAPIEIANIWGTGYRASGFVEIDWSGL